METNQRWEELYEQTVLEVNVRKMSERIAATQQAIGDRLLNMERNSSEVQTELYKMDAALSSLKVLSHEIEGWQSTQPRLFLVPRRKAS